MTCENYYVDADAMNLIARHMNIHTFSYQYSNMSKMNSTMMTTADTLFTFSDQFHGRWRKNGIGPKAFVNIGYVFDSSFSLMSDRALTLH